VLQTLLEPLLDGYSRWNCARGHYRATEQLRAQVWLQVEWELPSGLKTKEVLAMKFKSGDPPYSPSSPVGTAATHSLAAGGDHRIEDGVHRQDPNPAYSTSMHHPPAHPPTTVIVHGSEWVEEPVLIPIGGMVPRLHWSVRS
jgi:hypothetical protein